MKLFCSLALILLTLTVCCGQTGAQKSVVAPPKTIEPKQILQQAAAACQKIKTIEYQEEQFTGGAAQGPAALTAIVRQARADVPTAGLLPGKFLIEGTVNNAEPIRFAISYDGAALRVLDAAEKVVKVLKKPTPYKAGQLLSMSFGMVGLPHFTADQPFKELLDKGSFVYEGLRIIGGVSCHVLAVTWTIDHPTLGQQTLITRWFIGREDYLPRGYATLAQQKQLRILKVNPPDNQTEYALATPAGYGEQLVTGNESKAKGLLSIGLEAPDWTLQDPQGRTHSLRDYRGQVVLLDFWGTWCLPCRRTMPTIQKLHEKFKARGVVIFGISIIDKEGQPVEYMKRLGLTYNLLLNGDEVALRYQAAVLPTLYIIGVDGKIIHAEYGFRDNAQAELSAIIDRYLQAQRK